MSKRRIIDHPHAVDLTDFDPAETNGVKHKDEPGLQQQLQVRLLHLQTLLYAAAHQSILIVLQGMDTAGKDGTIKHVMDAVNPAGCQVWNFKQPTPDEAAHDFLWRVHQRTPGHGIIGVFNRSHYEDVLVVRVHKLVPRDVWQARYEQINQFEHMLAQNGTIILKFFLHISKDEQRDRLLAREDDPEKAWKLSVEDWHERALWDDYHQAYADMLSQCGTEWAPWYIVPANKKWYRNLFILQSIVDRLAPLEKDWNTELEARGKAALAALKAANIAER
jgi:PPK2 family polyphosphate:nucleotide phosphotransferase